MQFDIILLDTLFGLPCWLLWLLASLLSGLLGYLIGWGQYNPYRNRVVEVEAESQRLHNAVVDWEKRYVELEYQRGELDKSNTSLRAALNHCEADKAALSAKIQQAAAEPEGDDNDEPVSRGLAFAGAAADGNRSDSDTDYLAILGRDNLQIIEGIGPKIEQLLKNSGYTTWAALADADFEDLRRVLDEAGPRYRIHDPKSWSEQARLAAEGKWDELIRYQKFLDGGKENEGDFESDSKLEKLVAKKMGFSTNPNDLKIVEGIGPKIEGLLNEAGINSWSDLAVASVDHLREILAAAGDRYRLADPATWPKQADLASKGKWDELREYQNFLSGGKDPV